VGFRRTRGIKRAPILTIMNLGRKAPPLPPIRVSARVQARAKSPAATSLIDESYLSIEGLDAAKEAREFPLLEDKQVHKKTNFRTTTTTSVPPTRVSARIQARAASPATNEKSEELRLSIEGLDAEKEARESALLQKRRGRRRNHAVVVEITNFEEATTTRTK